MGNKRIAINAFFTIWQSLIATVCGLFTGRWVLNALGDEGYGVFSVVGGVMVFVLFFNSVLTNSACRHFAYAIGRSKTMPESERLLYLGQWFTASLYVHLLLPILLCGIGFVAGEWYIANKFVVDESIRGECFWVFRFSLISAFLSIVTAPYFALYTAKQLIFVRTLFGFGATVLNAMGSYSLFFFDSDRIFWHAVILMSIQVLTAILISLFAMIKFPETRQLKYGTKMSCVRELFAFGGAQMLGMFGNMMRSQGMSIVANLYSGLKVNAGMGLGNQVTNRLSIFATSTMSAILPEVTSCLAAGDIKRAFGIADRVNLFVTMSYSLFIFPVLANIGSLLHIWLGNPPDTASIFCGISLFVLYLDALTSGYQQLINANGKIFIYQLWMGGLLVSSVLIATAAYMLGFEATVSVGLGMLLPTVGSSIVRIVFVKKLFMIGSERWFSGCLCPNIVVLFVSCSSSYAFVQYFNSGLWQFFVSALINIIVVAVTAYLIISDGDRQFLRNKVSYMVRKIKKA